MAVDPERIGELERKVVELARILELTLVHVQQHETDLRGVGGFSEELERLRERAAALKPHRSDRTAA
jgi:hypothetical protein